MPLADAAHAAGAQFRPGARGTVVLTAPGQVIDVYVSVRRAAADAATSFRRAIEAIGVIPDAVTTDGAAAYLPALALAFSPVAHETGKQVQQRIERDHQQLKGRLRPTRGFETLAGARVLCRGHAFLRNLRGGSYALGRPLRASMASLVSPVALAWDALTADLLTRCGLRYPALGHAISRDLLPLAITATQQNPWGSLPLGLAREGSVSGTGVLHQGNA